jgi:hypothetical protein
MNSKRNVIGDGRDVIRIKGPQGFQGSQGFQGFQGAPSSKGNGNHFFIESELSSEIGKSVFISTSALRSIGIPSAPAVKDTVTDSKGRLGFISCITKCCKNETEIVTYWTPQISTLGISDIIVEPVDNIPTWKKIIMDTTGVTKTETIAELTSSDENINIEMNGTTIDLTITLLDGGKF